MGLICACSRITARCRQSCTGPGTSRRHILWMSGWTCGKSSPPPRCWLISSPSGAAESSYSLLKMPSRDGACPVSDANGDAASRVSTIGSIRDGSAWYQQQLPGRLAAFQFAVGLYRLLQRINVFDPQLELLLANHSEYGPSALLQLLSSND